jgi:hypothetical protein
MLEVSESVPATMAGVLIKANAIVACSYVGSADGHHASFWIGPSLARDIVRLGVAPLQ